MKTTARKKADALRGWCPKCGRLFIEWGRKTWGPTHRDHNGDICETELRVIPLNMFLTKVRTATK